MKIEYLADVEDNSVIAADLVIVGAGPAGLTIAAQCAASGRRILIVESGLERENSEHSALNEIESAGEPRTEAQFRKRKEFHGHRPNSGPMRYSLSASAVGRWGDRRMHGLGNPPRLTR